VNGEWQAARVSVIIIAWSHQALHSNT